MRCYRSCLVINCYS